MNHLKAKTHAKCQHQILLTSLSISALLRKQIDFNQHTNRVGNDGTWPYACLIFSVICTTPINRQLKVTLIKQLYTHTQTKSIWIIHNRSDIIMNTRCVFGVLLWSDYLSVGVVVVCVHWTQFGYDWWTNEKKQQFQPLNRSGFSLKMSKRWTDYPQLATNVTISMTPT